MSGFEHSRDVLKDKLGAQVSKLQGLSVEEMNKQLLSQLRQSSDIARDLAVLYSERPYVYARVMQQLGRVIGKVRVNRLHSAVVARTKAAKQRNEEAQKTNLRKALRSGISSAPAKSSSGGEAAGTGVEAKEEAKSIKLNIPILKLNKEIKIEGGLENPKVSCDDWNTPYLKDVSAEATFSGMDVKRVELSANFAIPNIRTASKVKFTLNKDGENWKPQASFDADVDLAGIIGQPQGSAIKAKISISSGEESAEIRAHLSGTVTVLGIIKTSASGEAVFANEQTDFNGKIDGLEFVKGGISGANIKVPSIGGGRSSSGQASGGKESGSGKESSGNAASSGAEPSNVSSESQVSAKTPVSAVKSSPQSSSSDKSSGKKSGGLRIGEIGIDGDIALVTHGDDVSGITGTLDISNLSFLSSPSDKISLQVTCDKSAGLSAQLKSAVSFAAVDLGNGSTAALSINSASFDESKHLCAEGEVAVCIGGIFKAVGAVSFENNALKSGSLTIDDAAFSLPKENSIISGNLAGSSVLFDANGFVESNITLNETKIKIGTSAISLDGLMTVDAAGNISGTVDQTADDVCTIGSKENGSASISEFHAAFNSTEGLTEALGRLAIDAKNLKSDEGGIPISYAGNVMTASGSLSLLRGGKDELGKCTFDAQISQEGFSGNGDVVLTSDYKVDDTKLIIKKDSNAHIAITDAGIEPVKFEGAYSYGAEEGGEGEEGSEAQTPVFEGTFTNCVLDLATGDLSGTATGELKQDVVLEKKRVKLTLCKSFRKNGTDMTASFEASQLTKLTGTITYKASIKGGEGNDDLDLEGCIKDFNYDCAGNTFSGFCTAGLNKNYTVNDNVTLLGNNQSQIDVTLESNTVTAIAFSLDADLTAKNAIFDGGSAVFTGRTTGGSIDVNTGAVSIESVTLKPKAKDGVKMTMHKGDTHLTLGQTSSLETSVVSNQVKGLTGNIDYTGDTKALKTDTPLEAAGKIGLNIDDLSNPDAKVSGELEIHTTSDCVLDSIPDVDSITLLEGCSVKVELSDNELQTVEGNFSLKYANTDKNKFIPNGYEVQLDGEDIKYDVQNKLFSGNARVSLSEELEIDLSKGKKEQIVTLLPGATQLTAAVSDNKLTSLNGGVSFKAQFKVGQSAKDGEDGGIAITDGNATVDFNVDTGEINSFQIDTVATCNFKAGKSATAPTVSSEGCHLSASADSKGLASASLDGNVKLTIPKDGEREQVVFDISGAVNYKRESGIDGSVSVVCKDKTKLGRISSKNSGKGFSYGLGQQGGEGASSAEMTAIISQSELTALNGQAGFYLTQDPVGEGEDALNVTGNINFDYDVANHNLKSLTGTIHIDRKELAPVGSDKLVILPSDAEIIVANDSLEKISGQVSLALNDGQNDYITFESEGEFDCIDTKTFSGTVKVTVAADKQLVGKGKEGLGVWLTKEGSTGIDAEIVENEITKLNGGIGFKTTLNSNDFFGGSVEGSYLDGKVNGTGKITLLKDIALPEESPVFSLKKGSGGQATVTDNALATISGDITVGIAPPGQRLAAGGDGGSEIIIKASAEVDVQNANVIKATGTVETQAPFEIFKGLTLTKFTGSAGITNNQLDEMSGSAEVVYKKDSFNITGGCDFKWIKGEDRDKYSFSGNLSVTAFNNKLHGTTDITYDNTESENAAPQIKSKLQFQITDWLGGEIGVEFTEGKGWDDPIIDGSITVTDVELISKRSLMSFSKSLGVDIPVFTGINVSAGVELGASVEMDPVTISGDIKIDKFHLSELSGGALPNFEMKIGTKAGLNLNAKIAPYIGLSVGIANVITAGLRVKGQAQLTAGADASITGKLSGGKDGFNGELDLGFGITGSASVSIIPEVYLALMGGKEWKYPFKEWKYDLGDLFNVQWGKTFRFGDKGTETAENPGAAQNLPAESQKDTSTEVKEGATLAEFSGKNSPAESDKTKPNMPASKSVGEESMGKKAGSDANSAGGIQETIQQVTDISKAIGAISGAVEIISGVIQSTAVAGPLGAVGYLAFKIIKGDITLAKIKQGITDIKKGLESLKALINNNADLIKSVLPEWMLKIIDFFKEASEEGLFNKIVDIIEEKINGLGEPLASILQPVVELAKKKKSQIADIAAAFTGGISGAKIAKAIFAAIGLSFGSIGDIVKCGIDIFKNIMSAVNKCIEAGYIYTKGNEYRFYIPGLTGDWKGSSFWISGGLNLLFGKKIKKK